MMRRISSGLGGLVGGAMTLAVAASLVGCGSSSSSTGGTTGGSSTSSASSSSGSSSGGSSSAAPSYFCDGIALTDPSGNQFYVETYAYNAYGIGGLISGGCYTTLGGYVKDGGPDLYVQGYSAAAAGGILDVDLEFDGLVEGTGTSPTGAASIALFPGGCDDMGLTDGTGGAPAGDGGVNFTLPAGAQTVASVVAAGAVGATGPIVGVVTLSYPWTTGATPESGDFYLQDPALPDGGVTPASGILVYLDKDDIGSNVAPQRGDVVSITGFTWSPYNGHDKSDNLPGYSNSQNQLSSGTGATVTVIGTAPLPPAVPLTAAQVSPTGTSEKQYYGMRVNVTGGPFTVSGTGTGEYPSWTCPAGLATVHTGD